VNNVLEIRNARKRFGRIHALNDLSLTLREGECLGLVGPNGAGKTTILRAICGRVRLDSGSIARRTDERGAPAAMLGLVPQEIALYPLLTGTENLEVFGGLHGMRGTALNERVAWALDWSGLADRAEEPVNRWSVGMKRRLNIACGVLHNPRVILLDEPTVGVDPESRQRIWGLLHGLRASGASLLLTTHQLNEAQSVSDRIAVVDKGRVIACGTSQQIVRDALGVDHRVVIQLSDGTCIVTTVRDVSSELRRLLERIEGEGATVQNLEVSAPNLEAAFLELTRLGSGND
jgi:ABC-2 type transport system ATP-binding protein